MALGSSVGATKSGNSPNNTTFSWNATTTAWNDPSNWVNSTLQWNYEIKQTGTIVGQPVYGVYPEFIDLDTTQMWLPQQNTFHTDMTDYKVNFALNPGMSYQIPADSRENLPPPKNTIKGVFPVAYTFQLDTLAQYFTGAMLVVNNSNQIVYGISGAPANPVIVGKYEILSSQGIKYQFSVWNSQLAVDGKLVKGSYVIGNKLVWNELMDHPCLPFCGEIEFSADGERIVSTSISEDAQGGKVYHDEKTLKTVIEKAAVLDIYQLVNMDPTDSTGQDMVQKSALGDFYNVLQYYMDPTLRSTFIATNVPSLPAEVNTIAHNSSLNQSFYQSLQVPYLVNQLSFQTGDDAVKKLNYLRARKWLENTLSKSKTYQSQASDLYNYEWRKYFPVMQDFINDQVTNRLSYNTLINNDIASWKTQLTADLALNNSSDTAIILAAVENLKAPATSGKYWAYTMFRYLTTDNWLGAMNFMLLSGNTSQSLVNDIKRFCAILSMLDTSNYFTGQFLNIIKLVQISNVLASVIDYGSGDVLSDFQPGAIKLLEAFITAFINSADPQMQQTAVELNAALAVQGGVRYIDTFIKLLFSASKGAGALGGWGNFMATYEQKVISTIGAGGLKLARIVALGFGVVGMGILISGELKFSALPATLQAQLIIASSAVFIQGMFFFLKKGLNTKAFWTYTQSQWPTLKYFLTQKVPEVSKGFVAANNYESKFAKWMVSTGQTSAFVEGEAKWVARFFGRNLGEFMATRFAAALSIVGIVLSAIELSKSTTPLEKTMNALMLTSSILELVAAAATWIGAGLAAGAGATALSVLAGLASALAIVAAIAGVIILLVMFFSHKEAPPTPIYSFVYGQATNAGFFMSYNADIDFFDEITDTAGKITKSGVTLCVNKDSTKALKAVKGNTLTDFTLQQFIVTHTWDTVFQLKTDENGYTTITTRYPSIDAPPVSLCCNDSRQLTMVPTITEQAKYQQQLWKAEIQGDVQTYTNSEDDMRLTAASFYFYNVFHFISTGVKYYLQGNGTVAANAPVSFFAEMAGTRPDGMTMDNIMLVLADKDSDLIFFPVLPQEGSNPRGFQIVNSPPLPPFLSLDSTDGSISVVKGEAFTEMSQQYYLDVTNGNGNCMAGFTIIVLADYPGGGW